MDADDECVPGRLAAQWEAMQARPGLLVLGCAMELMGAEDCGDASPVAAASSEAAASPEALALALARGGPGEENPMSSSTPAVTSRPLPPAKGGRVTVTSRRAKVARYPTDPGFAAWAMLFRCACNY